MGPAAKPDMNLSADVVRAQIERSLTWRGNKRVKVGEIKEADDDTIVAEIVTQDGNLVQRFKVVRHGRYVTFQLAEVAVPSHLFRVILRPIAQLRAPSAPA